MLSFFWYTDLLVFIFFSIWVIYVLAFACASRIKRKSSYPHASDQLRFAILFPAYKEDNVILESVQQFKKQQYPSDRFRIIVISDQMLESTNQALAALDIMILHPQGVKRSKASALDGAMSRLDSRDYDVVVVMDADNIVYPDFLSQVNNAFASGARAVQTHRTAKNKGTTAAMLDGVSEEINNSIFRLGHTRLGLPASLIGSGMAFDFNWFRERIPHIESMGEDKFLEYYLLLDRIDTVYLEDVFVLDEKIQNSNDFSQQRRRWIASQVDIFKVASKQFGKAISTQNWPLVDKIFQWSMPPRIIMLGILPLLYIGSLFLQEVSSLKWFILFILYMAGLALAIPSRLYSKPLLIAVFSIPRMFFAMLSSIFHFRSGRTTFIHTKHGDLPDKVSNDIEQQYPSNNK